MVLNEGIAAELLLQWNEACERHNIIKDAIAASAGRSSIDLVKAVSSASCSQDGVLSIPNNSELWTKVVDSSLTELFSSIISNSNTNILVTNCALPSSRILVTSPGPNFIYAIFHWLTPLNVFIGISANTRQIVSGLSGIYSV